MSAQGQSTNEVDLLRVRILGVEQWVATYDSAGDKSSLARELSVVSFRHHLEELRSKVEEALAAAESSQDPWETSSGYDRPGASPRGDPVDARPRGRKEPR